jgi:ribosomal protein S18 acetylase RimI-like enzyme
MSEYHVRGFEGTDGSACVDIMGGNTPEFFTEIELAEFPAFLASRDSRYLVVEDQAGRLVACGGYHVNSPERWGGLTWGMVASGEQRRGIGSLLLRVRLERLREEGVNEVRLDTSQLSRAFYERHGFVVVSIQPDGYRPGLDRWDMKLSIDPSA